MSRAAAMALGLALAGDSLAGLGAFGGLGGYHGTRELSPEGRKVKARNRNRNKIARKSRKGNRP